MTRVHGVALAGLVLGAVAATNVAPAQASEVVLTGTITSASG